MKKLILMIALGLGGYAWASAQTAAATSNSSAPKAACCQKGSTEAKACCAKDSKTASASSCSGHAAHDNRKAEAAAAPTPVATEQKPAKKASSK